MKARRRRAWRSTSSLVLAVTLGLAASCGGKVEEHAGGAGKGTGGLGAAGSHAGTSSRAGTSTGLAGTSVSASGVGGVSGRRGMSAGRAGSTTSLGGAGGASGSGTGGASGSGAGGASGSDGGATEQMAGGGPTDADPGCKPILSQSGFVTGFEQCDDGTKRRRTAERCPDAATGNTECPACTGPYCCTSDDDCTRLVTNQNGNGPLGVCANAHHYAGYCGCLFGCRKDADCGEDRVCECGAVLGACVPATCKTNDDCDRAGSNCVATVTGPLEAVGPLRAAEGGAAGAGSGNECALNGHPSAYACETAADHCRSNADCGNDYCVMVDGARECLPVCPI